MPERGGQSYYDILEVRTDATADEIESSYRGMLAYLGAGSLAMYSMMDEEEVARLRSQVDEAYRTLKDPERRAAYDRALAGGESLYPSLMLPHAPSDTHVTIGRVMTPLPPGTTQAAASASPPAAIPSAPVSEAPARAAPEVSAPSPVDSLPTPAPAAASQAASRADASPTPVPVPIRAAAPAPPLVKAPFSLLDAARRATPLPSSRMAPAAAARSTPVPPPVTVTKRPVRRLRPKPDFDITPDTEYNGTLLRRLRESAQASLDELSEITKVSRRYLRALEDGDFVSLPAAVYVRGFVAEYAKALGLDPTTVCKSFMTLYKKHKGEGA
ncbi:MAG: helix-turn-helix domain-containing protein [Deltaproteobacteria bacterium]|nr:helix-turn-helix domain-containing protein [Deltaproteobacteria bacterium]